MYLKRIETLCKIDIQIEKEWFNYENFEKNEIFSFAILHIGGLCTKTFKWHIQTILTKSECGFRCNLLV